MNGVPRLGRLSRANRSFDRRNKYLPEEGAACATNEVAPDRQQRTMAERRALIIGAGPAGLTAAFELIKRTDIQPIVLEKSEDMGGISRTVRYKGNRMDIGGHRFFSKSDRVMKWWMDVMPVEAREPRADTLEGRE